jgi:predicted RNA binding protein YcfA (HicA-like mRNA interferase family)
MHKTKIPALNGKQPIKLIDKDGLIEHHRLKTKHGKCLKKHFPAEGRWRVTVIPYKDSSLPIGTLFAILGPKQTNIGRRGLLDILNR